MQLGERFGALLHANDAVLYEGSMGMGKTVFTRGIARHFGVEDEVSSPSFALVNEYQSTPVICHFDLWRITDPDDLYSIGWQDYLEKPVILLVEWAENAGEARATRAFVPRSGSHFA